MCSTFGKMVSARGAGTLSAVWYFSLLACGVGVWRGRVACGAGVWRVACGAGAPHAPGRERKAWSCSEHEPSGPPSAAAAAVPWAPRRLRPALANVSPRLERRPRATCSRRAARCVSWGQPLVEEAPATWKSQALAFRPRVALE